LAAQEHLALCWLINRSNQVEHRRLATTGSTEYDDKLAVFHSQTHASGFAAPRSAAAHEQQTHLNAGMPSTPSRYVLCTFFIEMMTLSSSCSTSSAFSRTSATNSDDKQRGEVNHSLIMLCN
jgi:hypothetical protein